ncbi:hypothetical protein ACHAXR_011645 [Thalassiosira sp. AJA248-18]
MQRATNGQRANGSSGGQKPLPIFGAQGYGSSSGGNKLNSLPIFGAQGYESDMEDHDTIRSQRRGNRSSVNDRGVPSLLPWNVWKSEEDATSDSEDETNHVRMTARSRDSNEPRNNLSLYKNSERAGARRDQHQHSSVPGPQADLDLQFLRHPDYALAVGEPGSIFKSSHDSDDSDSSSLLSVNEEVDKDGTEDSPTESEVFSFGLSQVGFDENRQHSVCRDLNIERFKAHYGIEPITVWAIFRDLKKDHPSVNLKHFMLALNWFKLYDTEHVLAGRWGNCEDHIRAKVKEYARKIQSLKTKKIVFGGWGDEEVHIITVDGVNFMVQEFRLDPGAKWFDHKTKSAGLTYELAIAIRRNKLVWIKGPEPAGSKHDITIFRGGTKEQGKKKWDPNSLYFKLPAGKKAVGDSGYAGEPGKVTTTRDQHSSELKKFLGRAKNRQESFHARLKSFNILGQRFRHGKSTKDKMAMHKTCVEAVCVIVQYDLENGHPLFEV